MEKILTIVVPTYNMERYIDKCLTSLIIEDKELMCQLEVLVVIDGAKDHSSEIAHTYQDRYPETFRVIDKENGNYGSCVNRGLKEATGKYIKVLDADDSFDNAEFDKYLRELETIDVDLIINGGGRFTEDGHNILTWKLKYDKKTVEKFSDESPMWIHNLAYRTRLLKEMNYHQTEGMSYTDNEWSFFPFEYVQQVCYLPYNLYKYLVGREGQTVNTAVLMRSISQEIFIANEFLDYWEKHDYHKHYKCMMSTTVKKMSLILYIVVTYNCKEYILATAKLDERFKRLCSENYNSIYEYHYLKGKSRHLMVWLWRNNGYKMNFLLNILAKRQRNKKHIK